MSDEMGTTTTVPTESASRLAGTEQVKHTPGPFHITTDRGPDHEFCFHSIRGDDGLAVVSTFAPDSEEQSEADAKLFAAAPDMLAALRDVKQWLGTDLFTSADVYQTRCAKSLELIRAAIAKAEGRTP